MIRVALLAALALSVEAIAPLKAAPEADENAAPAPPPIIRSIVIEVVDVFDREQSGENRLFHRAVDALHVQTRDNTVRRELLFREGDVLDPERLAESERNLRTLAFLRRVDITTRPNDDGTVDVHVRVQDSWSTRATYHLSRSGGNTKGGLAAQEENLLGLGKSLALSWQSNQDRNQTTFSYHDQALAGSHIRFSAAHEVSSDGSGDIFSIQRPFLSFDTPWAWGVQASRLDQNQGVWAGGDKLIDYGVREQEGALWYSLSRPQTASVVHRWTIGWHGKRQWTEETECRSALAEFGMSCIQEGHGAGQETIPPEALLPFTRKTSAVTAGFESFQREWVKVENVVRMNRAEDFNLGRVLTMTAGPSLRATGGSDNEVLFDGSFQNGLSAGRNGFVLLRSALQSRMGSGSAATNVLSLTGTWYDTHRHRQTLAARMSIDAGENLDGISLLQLGGDEGLRGFDSRVAAGTRRFLATFEDRLWTKRELFRLFYVGATAFVDVGNAWGGPLTPHFGTLYSDVGIGLRLDASRAAHGGMLRLDFGVPVSGDRFGGPSIQFSFGHGPGW